MKLHTILILALCLGLTGHALARKPIPNHAIANLVLGQTDFVTGDSPAVPGAAGLDYPLGVAVDPITQKVFVSDADNNRVLRYPNAEALKNGAPAEAVFGQTRFDSSDDGSGKLNMYYPSGLFFDRFGRLWVVCSFHFTFFREQSIYCG